MVDPSRFRRRGRSIGAATGWCASSSSWPPLSVSLLTNRRLTAPYGAEGGSPGQPGRNLLRRAGETEFCYLSACWDHRGPAPVISSDWRPPAAAAGARPR